MNYLKVTTVIRVEGEPQELLSELIEAFKQKQGNVAPFLIGRKLENIMTSDISPPEELKAQI